MPIFVVQRRANVEESTTFELDIPPFIQTAKDIDFYVRCYAMDNKQLKWQETTRTCEHFYRCTEDKDAIPTISSPSKDVTNDVTESPENFQKGFRLLGIQLW